MVTNKKLLWSLAALPILAACSSDGNLGGSPDPIQGVDGVYMTVTLDPSGRLGTRSQTSGDNASNDGVEIGSDEENALKSVLIVIADRQNKFITSSVVPSADGKGTITSGTVGGNNVEYKTTARFEKTDIASYYDAAGADGKVNVYVFCNPTGAFLYAMENVASGSTEWVDFEWKASDHPSALWNPANGFPMSNVSVAPRELPSKLKAWENYSEAETAFDLSGVNSSGTDDEVDNLSNNRGSIPVHRMAARIDFRDGSQVDTYDAEGNLISNGVKGTPFTYGVVTNAAGETIVNCELYAMALTNMSNSQYYLGRVSDNGLLTGANYQLCGPERAWFNNAGGNYVVSTNAQAKYDEIKSNFDSYFEYPFFSPEGLVQSKGSGWDWIRCDQVVKDGAPKDNYVSGDYNKSFNVWRYLAENTIPGPANKQINSQSTGVVFKSRMLPTSHLNDAGSDKWENMLYDVLNYEQTNVGAGKLLHKDADADPILYSLSGKSLYVTWENVREVALSDAGFDETKGAEQILDRKAPMYRLCYGEGGVGTVQAGDAEFVDDLDADQTSVNYLWQKWQDAMNGNKTAAEIEAAKKAFKKAATEHGFILYQSSLDQETGKWGYYCYYYYWNRHNDNQNDNVMGPMEFGVVRNNVYKLSVVRLSQLGHPRIPENDPDDPKPDDPDEKSEVYMKVTIDVIPWVVRINNIGF